MAKLSMRAFNPFAFTPIPVTVIVVLVYVIIGVSVIVVHESVPKAPSNPTEVIGLNTTEAWLDLATLSHVKHPFNTHQSDEVRDWLLLRIEQILGENGVQWSNENSYPKSEYSSTNIELAISQNSSAILNEELQLRGASPAVTVFNDLLSNVTIVNRGTISSGQEHVPTNSIYFEGTNIMVYIRGTEDEEGDWWNTDYRKGHGGVLVNAHYDSVSTGFGATDNGVGVVTTLQMIKYFTTKGNAPKKGIVALFNNGEEDQLLGARAFVKHPLSKFVYTFLNLEGTGPGGRTILLRSTDLEVAKAYATSPHPYGTVVSKDGFKLGAVRSQTDYVIFNDILGSRGLDVTYWSPRARYHTEQDDLKHTTLDSLWHMLSVSYHTMEALTSDTGSTFEGQRDDGEKGKVRNGHGSEEVWFDIYGDDFAVLPLRGLFAWALTLLIVGPLTLFLLTYLLIRQDKSYFLATKAPKIADSDETVFLYGWRGAFSFPISFVFSVALAVGAAFLLTKVNPLVIYSNKYTVWAMMVSLTFWAFWFVMRGSDFVRPSALQRGYAFIWLFTLGWVALVAVTVLADRFHIASGYLIVFLESALFLATIISFCELFALSSKAEFAQFSLQIHQNRNNNETLPDSEALIAPSNDEIDDDPTEETPLFRHDSNRRASHITTFANYARRALGPRDDDAVDKFDEKHTPYGDEQAWSGKLPSSLWTLQFLLVAPFMIIILGQAGLFLVQGVNQTGPDGSSQLTPHICVAIFTILILLPLTPFIHRITYHVPTFLFLVFIGTLIFNLTVFPFNDANRVKSYFLQTVDLETGQNNVSLAGLEEYNKIIIGSLPSAAGQSIECAYRDTIRANIRFCTYAGLPPRVISPPITDPTIPPEKYYSSWLTLSSMRHQGSNSATFVLTPHNSRACVLRFARPIKNFHVHGSAPPDPRFAPIVPPDGSDEIRLFHRDWETPFVVDVEWFPGDTSNGEEEIRGMEGRAVCYWTDDNTVGLIPALDEFRQYAPTWAAVTQMGTGLVEGSKGFVV